MKIGIGYLSGSDTSHLEAQEEALYLSRILSGERVFGIYHRNVHRNLEGLYRLLLTWSTFFKYHPGMKYIQLFSWDGAKIIQKAIKLSPHRHKIILLGINPTTCPRHDRAYYYQYVSQAPFYEQIVLDTVQSSTAKWLSSGIQDPVFVPPIQYVYYNEIGRTMEDSVEGIPISIGSYGCDKSRCYTLANDVLFNTFLTILREIEYIFSTFIPRNVVRTELYQMSPVANKTVSISYSLNIPSSMTIIVFLEVFWAAFSGMQLLQYVSNVHPSIASLISVIAPFCNIADMCVHLVCFHLDYHPIPMVAQTLLCAYSATAVLKDSFGKFSSIRDAVYRSAGHVLNYKLPKRKVSHRLSRQMQNIRMFSTLLLMVLITSFFFPCFRIFPDASVTAYNITHVLSLSLVMCFSLVSVLQGK